MKKKQIPQWITKEIKLAMKYRDDLKAAKDFNQYKKQRNYVKNLIKKAKKTYFQDMINKNTDISEVWRAINILSGHSKSKDINTNITLDQFNNHFLSIADSLTKTLKTNSDDYIPSEKLKSFCASKVDNDNKFILPTVSENEVRKIISSLKNKKTLGSDGISVSILKMSLPCCGIFDIYIQPLY